MPLWLPDYHVPPHEESWEYNPSWGGPAPVLWLHAGHQSNVGDATAFDLSPYRNNGTWNGNTTGRNVVTAGGRAWSYDKSTDYLATPINGPTTSGRFCYAFRFMVTSAADWRALAYSSAGGYGPTMEVRSDNALFFRKRNSSTILDGVGTITLNTWHTAACQMDLDNDTAELYLDGKLDNSTASATLTFTERAMDVGGTTFPGYIQWAAFFDDCLTTGQHWALHTSSLDGSPGVMARPIGRRVFKATAVTPTATVAGRLPQRRVEPHEAEFEYNPSWGGPAPVLWMHAGHGANKGDTTAFDLSPYRNNGTWSGSTTGRSVVTERGRGYQLTDANSDYLSYAHSPLWAVPADQDLTVAAWVRMASTPSHSIIASHKNGTYAQAGWWFFLHNAYEDLRFQIGDGATDDEMEGTTALTPDVWYHAAVVYRRSSLSDSYLYLNGVDDTQNRVADTPRPGAADSTTPLRVGAASWAVMYEWDGCLQDVAVFPAALSHEQVWNLYTSSLDGSPGIMARPIGRRVFAVGTAPSGAITGTASVTLAASGSLTATGALAGTASVTLAASGALASDGDVSGTASVALDASGVLTGTGALTGTASASLSATGNLTAAGTTGALSGTASATVEASGTLTGTGGLTGAISLAVEAAGAITGSAPISGTASVTLAASGALQDAPDLVAGPYSVAAAEVFISGAAAGQVSVTGAAAGQVFTSGAAAGQVSA